MEKIKIGIYGYGNLGKGVELAVNQSSDMELVGIFTKRKPSTITPIFNNSKIYNKSDINLFKDKIDVMILCGGSANELPEYGPQICKVFNTVDSFDNHAKITEYFSNMNESAKGSNHLSLISCGWDPGLFSLNRVLLESILPNGKNYVFYGKGLSQGHSNAIRKLEGVKKAVQYTVPYEDAIKKVKNGENPIFNSVKETMWRECFVVLEENAIPEEIENKIKTMPNYFEPYNTIVHFISEEEFDKNHSSMPHGGFVLRSGNTSNNSKQIAEFSLKLDSNPEFTSSVLVAYARAIYRLYKKDNYGAITVLDIPLSYISPKTSHEILKMI